MDKEDWKATVYGATKSLDTTEQINTFTTKEGKKAIIFHKRAGTNVVFSSLILTTLEYTDHF